jgi:hypothetical protein
LLVRTPVRTSLFSARVALVLWLTGTTALGGAVTALHVLTLPDQHPRQSVDATTAVTALHALAWKCPCSKRVVEALLARRPVAGVRERVALIDGPEETAAALRAQGFEVDPIDAATLEARYGLTGAPVLVVRRSGVVAYLGGYAPRRNLPPVDAGLISSVSAGQSPSPYPLFGCAVGKALQQQLDPLNLKYGAW